MKIDRVTITGADDSIAPEVLGVLSHKYPYVEWGILVSKSQEGGPRFPGIHWMRRLGLINEKQPLNLSLHLCGAWLRDLFDGDLTFPHDDILPMFTRCQLNTHGHWQGVRPDFWPRLKELDKDILFQIEGVNDWLYSEAIRQGVRAFPFFDRSHGAGVSPEAWPEPIADYCGYAGGLGPENIEHELERIEAVVGERTIWIDMETRVRSKAGVIFDPDKVVACLEKAARWVPEERK
jgi:hypothetical protein